MNYYLNWLKTKLFSLKEIWQAKWPVWRAAWVSLYARRRRTVIAVGILIVIAILWILPPAAYPVGKVVRIEKGMTINEAAKHLKEKKVIQSPVLFGILVRLMPWQPGVIAGDYMFNHRSTVFGIAYRLTTGSYDIVPVKVRIPEGATVRDIAIIIDNRLPNFNKLEFMKLASTSEGFLFPDTYFFMPTASTSVLIEEMRNNFNTKTAPLSLPIFKSNHTLLEIVTMASIIEKEAYGVKDRRMISGILWKRINAGMRLQVDAVFPYIIGRNTFDLTKKDLRFDSPYNTYRYAGLPPGPIGNPSLDAIKAAIEPTPSPYWFYLADRKGVTHYSVDFAQHVANKKKYLW